MRHASSSLLTQAITLILALSFLHQPALGGDMGLTLPAATVGSSNATSVRQNVCDRWQQFASNEIALKEALSGLSLNAIVGQSDFVNYDMETGLDPEDPGLAIEILDDLATRANFTWRKSFALQPKPNISYTEVLLWNVEHFDIAVDWFDKSLERLERGVAFVEPWNDGSMILIHRRVPPVKQVDLWNWSKPFEPAVWGLIILTVFLSAVVYQMIEFLNDERGERDLLQWFSDNLYLSSLNFTQNFEYAPNSVAGRIFGVSLGIWALVITATYTANLASFFVQEQSSVIFVETVEQAIVSGTPICVWGFTNHETFLRKKYKEAELVLASSETEALAALKRGECGLAAVAKDNWFTYELQSSINPDCDLEWVGREVKNIGSGFGVKADAGNLCSSLIRDVLNVHMIQYINEGGLAAAWARHRAKTQDNNCLGDASAAADGAVQVDYGTRRHLMSKPQQSISIADGRPAFTRRLKGGTRATGGGTTTTTSAQSALSVEAMIGTFMLHWLSMGFSLLLSVGLVYYNQWEEKQLEKDGKFRERLKFRMHGPIIGMPPPTNTTVITNINKYDDGSMEISRSRRGTFVVRNVMGRRNNHTPIDGLDDIKSDLRDWVRNELDDNSILDDSVRVASNRTGIESNRSRFPSHPTIPEAATDCDEPSTTMEEQPWRTSEWWKKSMEFQAQQQEVYNGKIGGVEERMEVVETRIDMILKLLQEQQAHQKQQSRQVEDVRDAMARLLASQNTR